MSLDLMGTHSSPVDSANKSIFTSLAATDSTSSLPYPSVLLQFFLEFTKVAKELKLMALAEGINIRQYIDGWLMTTNSKQQCQGYTHWGCILSRAWVGSQISKNQIYFQLHLSKLWLQFHLRVDLVFPTQRKSIVFLERQLPC